MVLFQEIDLNRAWEISPYNGAAFGALIVVMGAIIYYFVKQLDKKDEIIKEKDHLIKMMNDKAHESIDVITEKLTEIKYSKDSQNEKIVMMLEHLKEILNNQ
jgi:hypothetical protein